ncbi:biotin-dependent carboxyltransferase [Bacillus salacetis]|uniref:Biotin-dependent carboxyltransferase n=1 Tax=Bacillus salacetis TaxID=2315464 RepID=A0A3A1R6F6_9BACI|nr:biotin-dependent carboxyltransferase family protein [Bacillus salacetis]RIW35067.1 biotin-dependent carboxyltransferase [Bacillus salacetis]
MGFSVERSGLLTTIQDGGRIGYRDIGMPVSGPMDELAFRMANLLVGNAEGEAAVEITLQGPVLQFTSQAIIAICGADLNPSINDEPVSSNKPLQVRRGDVLRFGVAERGLRAYISFKGGMQVSKQLGSSSTNTLAKIGGYAGRPLKAGDKINLNTEEPGGSTIPWSLSPSLFSYLGKKEVRVIKSTQWDWFTEETQISFLSKEFMITPESDRMGYRLSGPPLRMKYSQELLTEGITKGTVQVPASGQPIVLMADSQPTGGYPKISNIITADLPVIAQKKPHETVTFKEVTLEDAYKALRNAENDIKLAAAAIRLKTQRG